MKTMITIMKMITIPDGGVRGWLYGIHNDDSSDVEGDSDGEGENVNYDKVMMMVRLIMMRKVMSW